LSYAAPQFYLPTPQVLGITSPWCSISTYVIAQAVQAASATGPAANQAIYVPIVVTTPATFTRGFWYNGSAPDGTNNVSVGIYTPDGTRQATTGNVALSGASVIQSAALTANYAAPSGLYYMAIEYSVGADANGCVAFGSSVAYKNAGAYTQAVGSNPLPATATFATWTAMVMPVFGITQTSFAI
jgi:hypothetical protein